jgi:hypothetical protein
MEFVDLGAGQADAISALYREAFTASEGPEEGALIGALAHRLLTGTPARDIHAFAARVEGELVGAIVFSRMSYAGDARRSSSSPRWPWRRTGRGRGSAPRSSGTGWTRCARAAWMWR